MSLLKLNPNFKPAFDGVVEATALVQKTAKDAKVLKAYLFGSSASGKNTDDSDLDILVIIPDLASETDYYKIVNQPFYSDRAVDWIFKKETDFNLQKTIGGVCLVAYQTGVVIYNDQEK